MATFYHHETARPHIFFNNVDKLLGVQATKSWPKYKTGVSKYTTGGVKIFSGSP